MIRRIEPRLIVAYLIILLIAAALGLLFLRAERSMRGSKGLRGRTRGMNVRS